MRIENTVAISTFFPTIALTTCLFYPLLKDFKRATQTHCGVPNILPSVSAAIGYDDLTMVFWLFCIVAHSPFRFRLAKSLHKTYECLVKSLDNLDMEKNHSNYYSKSTLASLTYFSLLFNRIELIGLLILTLFPSNTSYSFHKTGFMMFLFFSTLFITISCIIERQLALNSKPNGYRLKRTLAAVYTICLFSSITAFIIHNKYCLPYVYSVFGFFEVILIFSNIIFHASGVIIITQTERTMKERNSEFDI